MAKSKNTTIIFSAPASVIKEMRWVAKRDRIPPLKDAGYLPSNWGHDLLVSAIHLGDGVFKDITGLETYTEQELRRVDPEFQPKWLPIPGGPRSDGRFPR
ncbi:MAG: hypothetical protein HYZ71_00830 [Deltaproteobacteria bacterium]|nr:hypothetical protein [Deltaproteobacteria bacterium]